MLVNVQKGLYGVLGVTSGEALDTFSVNPPAIAHQEMGALIALVALTLWVGRGHLKDVCRKAFFNAADVDDSDEILSYRVAVVGALASLGFAGVWLYLSGMPPLVALLFLLSAFAIFVALTRIVAESGVPEARTPMMPQSFVATGIGTTAVGETGITALGFSFTWATELRVVVMASAAHALKLLDGQQGRHRLFFWALMLAVLVSMVSSMWAILDLSYRYGGINLNRWFLAVALALPSRALSPASCSIPPGLAGKAGFHGNRRGDYGRPDAGPALSDVVAVHPIGFPIAGLWLMSHSWFSIFLAWLCKAIVLKYWGRAASAPFARSSWGNPRPVCQRWGLAGHRRLYRHDRQPHL